MDSALGKLAIAGFEKVAGFVDTVRSDLMGEIDNTGLRMNRKNHPLHRGDEPIAVAEIGQEGDERVRRLHLIIPRNESPPLRIRLS